MRVLTIQAHSLSVLDMEILSYICERCVIMLFFKINLMCKSGQGPQFCVSNLLGLNKWLLFLKSKIIVQEA